MWFSSTCRTCTHVNYKSRLVHQHVHTSMYTTLQFMHAWLLLVHIYTKHTFNTISHTICIVFFTSITVYFIILQGTPDLHFLSIIVLFLIFQHFNSIDLENTKRHCICSSWSVRSFLNLSVHNCVIVHVVHDVILKLRFMHTFPDLVRFVYFVYMTLENYISAGWSCNELIIWDFNWAWLFYIPSSFECLRTFLLWLWLSSVTSI